MTRNSTLVGVFVGRKRILSFIEYVRNELRVPIKRIFIYEIEGNNREYLTTFNIPDRDKLVDINGATVVHSKNGSIFSINALNRLIDREKGNDNIDNNDYQLDWGKYRNKLILMANNELIVSELRRIDPKTLIF